MGLFDFIKPRRLQIDKKYISSFGVKIPLRIIKGRIIGHSIKTWTRCFDKDGNILRYGDGADEMIVREEDYKQLELYLKTEYVDGFISPDHPKKKTTIYFERQNLFNGFNHGDTIIYYGLYLTEGAIWTNYFLHNVTNGRIESLYSINTINERIFNNEKSLTELKFELDTKITSLTNKT